MSQAKSSLDDLRIERKEVGLETVTWFCDPRDCLPKLIVKNAEQIISTKEIP